MLPTSGFTITFNRSTDYSKLLIVIHAFAWLAVIFSGLSLSIKGILCAGLITLAWHIKQHPTPQAGYEKLTHHQNHWLLHPFKGDPIRFERVDVRIHCGLFVLLALSGEQLTIKLILFLDQLTSSQYRTLKLIGKAQ